jgi:protein involved in polysaccharide export with SLBB domain
MIKNYILKLSLGSFFLFVLLGAGCHVFAQTKEDNGVYYEVQPGDRLQITVYREEDLSGAYQVDPQGDLVFPLIGRVRSAKRSIEDVRQEIYQKLLADYVVNPEVSIARDVKTSTEVSLQSVFVLGHVKTPGSYNYDPGQTLMKVIAKAGGFAPTANNKKITIARNVNGQKNNLVVNADNIINGKENDMVMEPGDIVNVPRSVF